jgi:hypothetical protein
MVTTKSLRSFAAGCLADAANTKNPNHRALLISVARTWERTADVIERYVRDGRGEVFPDLKRKLN